MSCERNYSFLDRCALGIDQVVRVLTDNIGTNAVSYPANGISESTLNDSERRHAGALMRVNHTGEICAQALYQGQGLVSKRLKEKMQQAAKEEEVHLAWCRKRIDELGSHTSYLNPFWYAGSFCIGMIAGVIDDRVSLGFVAETETQVLRHLDKHMQSLPADDLRSHRILQHMASDEAKHKEEAVALGGKELPAIIKNIMALTSKLMVHTAYWI